MVLDILRQQKLAFKNRASVQQLWINSICVYIVNMVYSVTEEEVTTAPNQGSGLQITFIPEPGSS